MPSHHVAEELIPCSVSKNIWQTISHQPVPGHSFVLESGLARMVVGRMRFLIGVFIRALNVLVDAEKL